MYRVPGLLKSSSFTLAETHVVVSQRAVFGNDFEMPFRYADIDPLPFKLRARRSGASAAVGIVAIAAASALPIWSSTSLHLSDLVLLSALGIILVSGLLALLFLPLRVEITAFRNRYGNWLFSVRRSGNGAEYTSFLADLQSRISTAAQAESPAEQAAATTTRPES